MLIKFDEKPINSFDGGQEARWFPALISEGRKEGRKEGKKEGRNGGRKEAAGKKERRKEGKKYRREINELRKEK